VGVVPRTTTAREFALDGPAEEDVTDQDWRCGRGLEKAKVAIDADPICGQSSPLVQSRQHSIKSASQTTLKFW
jgi:hypothetical protein